MLLLSLVFYLKYEAPPEEQNFPMVMELLRAGEVREDDDSYVSPLDELFDRLEMVNPEHIALKYYRDYHSGSAKTLKSIQITLAARLEKFNLESLAGLTATDELDLPSLGEKKKMCIRDRHNARRSVRHCVYVLLADKQTFREKGRGQCEKEMCRYFSV